MYNVSASFLAAIKGSYNRSITADVYFARQYQLTVPISTGTITVDRTQTTRRSGSLTIGNPGFFPTYVASPLAPYGAELHVNYNLEYGSGLTETCPLGIFVINDVYEEQSTGGMPVVDMNDRSILLQTFTFPQPYDASGVQVGALISKFVLQILPYVTVNFASAISTAASTTYCPGSTSFSSDVWSAIQSLCDIINAEAYFDVSGNLQVVPVPVMTQASLSTAVPVWTFAAGSGGTLVTAKRTVTRTGVYNAVSVTGGATGSASAAPYAFASDNDPRSPTYFGPAGSFVPAAGASFGAQIYQYQNSMLTTQSQCTAAAATQLQNYLGVARSLQFTAVDAPMLEAGDIIKAVYNSTTSELHVLDNIVIPLGAESQFTGTTRTATYQLSAGT